MTAAWTPVALARDLPRLGVMPVCVDSIDVALWRSASGRLAAWADRCPHRGMRLSHGFVRGEALSCIYHGWSYGADGHCLRIPAHPDLAPPEAIRVPVFHATESSGVIWVAPEVPDGMPATVEGTALRSLTVEAAVDWGAAGFSLSGQIARGQLSGVGVTILMQPLPNGRFVLHALAEATASPSAMTQVSRGLEDMRRQAEGALA
ncbi:Rieske 2Fe-2S domain-containing protein [Tabrizicola sp. BL-A-41-H6]|uniref:Rieske 2Fe-2S domain-containing protein n=1 Tax=Tabrizicola sp. BL-A-41-H6 TaxID=3421107 RepID=UPI003D6782EF